MIASVAGEVLALRLDSVVVEVGGVGLSVAATPATLADLVVGGDARLHTTLIVREDSLTLYGFTTADARDAFETLQTISGVGPRLALAVLAVHEPEALRRAVAAGDLTALMKVPGIGRKGAQRMALELGDRLGAPAGGPAPAAVGPAPGSPGASGGGGGAAGAPVVEALVGLGWSARQAEDAVAAALAEDASLGADAAAVLRAALRRLGRR